MTNVLALTQFAFLTLGIVTLRIMAHANANLQASGILQKLNEYGLWLFAVPLVWIAFASVCAHVDRGPFSPTVARVTGVILSVLCFLFLVSVTFVP